MILHARVPLLFGCPQMIIQYIRSYIPFQKASICSLRSRYYSGVAGTHLSWDLVLLIFLNSPFTIYGVQWSLNRDF
jgi:hypothetical protein